MHRLFTGEQTPEGTRMVQGPNATRCTGLVRNLSPEVSKSSTDYEYWSRSFAQNGLMLQAL